MLGDWDYTLRILMVGDIATINEPLAYYHHRFKTDADFYGNSVHAGLDQHQLYDVLYRNSLVRPLLQKEPGHIGLLHVLLRQADDRQAQLSQLFNRNADWSHNRHVDLQQMLNRNAEWSHNRYADLRQVLDRNADWSHNRHIDLQNRIVQLESQAEELRQISLESRRLAAGNHQLIQQLVAGNHQLAAENRHLILESTQLAAETRQLVLEIHHRINQLIRPLRGIWRRITPLRRLVAKLRGRI